MSDGRTQLRRRPFALFAVLAWQVREYGGRLATVPVPGIRKDPRGGRHPTITYEPKGWVTCPLCWKRIDLGDARSWDADHIVPHSERRSDTRDNLRIVHRLCNSLRGDAPPGLDKVASSVL